MKLIFLEANETSHHPQLFHVELKLLDGVGSFRLFGHDISMHRHLA